MTTKTVLHLYARTIRGGFEKIRENMTQSDFETYYANDVHKYGKYKGQPRFRLRSVTVNILHTVNCCTNHTNHIGCCSEGR